MMIQGFHNRNLSINPPLTHLLTDATNTLGRGLTNREKEILEKAYHINVNLGLPFSYHDFNMSHNNFRHYIYKLKTCITVHIKSKPTFYKLKGVYLDEKLTDSYTVPLSTIATQRLDDILTMVKHRPPHMHDIKIKTNTNLYEFLIKVGKTPHPQNNTITIPINIPPYNTKARVTPNYLILDIGCTNNPIEYSLAGFAELCKYVGQVLHYLTIFVKEEFQTEPMSNWKFMYFHLNKDSIEFNFPKECTFNLVIEHAQLYAHKKDNGKAVIRYEEKLTPNITIAEETHTPRFIKASELSDPTRHLGLSLPGY